MCVHCATERETLEEKPFILPTDSPVSALTLGVLIWFPVTKFNYTGVAGTNRWTASSFLLS